MIKSRDTTIVFSRGVLLATLFFLSGFASLVNEILCSRLLQFSFGVSIHATSAVVAAFLAGLGLGALVLAGASRRTRKPTLVYGILELCVGVLMPAFPPLAKAITPALATIFSGIEPGSLTFASARFASAFCLLLVPSFFMGGTLPFLIRAAVPEKSARRSLGVGIFYGINTLGAGLGAVLAGYVLLPGFGYGGCVLIASGLSICVGLAAIMAGMKEEVPLPAPEVANGNASNAAEHQKSMPAEKFHMIPVAGAVFLGGCVSLSYEIIWTRILINVFGGTVYAFSLVLAVFLTALALGSVSLPWFLSRLRSPYSCLAYLLAFSAAAAGLSMLVFRAMLGMDGPLGDGYNLYPAAGEAFPATFLKYAGIAFAAVFPAVYFLGGMLPLAAGRLAEKGGLSRLTGRLYAVSSLGSILGSILGAFALLALLSAEGGIIACVITSLAAAVLLFIAAKGKKRGLFASGAAVCAAAFLVSVAAAWRPGHKPGVETVFFEEGAAATAKVESFENEDGETILSLRVNGKVVATTGFLDRRLQLLLGYFATLCHNDPQYIVSVGLGTGMSSGALSAHNPKVFEIVELSGSVVHAAGCFAEYNHNITGGRAKVTLADGRNRLLLAQSTHDLIAADPIHPWVAGSGNLYTKEYFDLAASRLNNGGVMCQWVPLYQLSAMDVRSVLATFHAVFPCVRVFYTGYDLVVVGAKKPMNFDPLEWKMRIRSHPIANDLASIGIDDLEDLLACFLFTERGLGEFLGMGESVVIRDADQTLEYSAPKSLFKPYDTGLIMELMNATEELYALAPEGAWPFGLDLSASARRNSYAGVVRAFFDEMARKVPGARKRFREKIKGL